MASSCRTTVVAPRRFEEISPTAKTTIYENGDPPADRIDDLGQALDGGAHREVRLLYAGSVDESIAQLEKVPSSRLMMSETGSRVVARRTVSKERSNSLVARKHSEVPLMGGRVAWVKLDGALERALAFRAIPIVVQRDEAE